jgi:hypothetical protein
MDAFIGSLNGTGLATSDIQSSCTKLLQGYSDKTTTAIHEERASFPSQPSAATIQKLIANGIIGRYDYPTYERTLNPSYMASVNPPFNIPPESMIANKSRVYPKQLNNLPGTSDGRPCIDIPPQNINDALKPVNKRYKYYVKPLASYETVDYLASQIDLKKLQEISKNVIAKGQIITENGEEIVSPYTYIPPELYNYNWHVFNKQFIMNRGKNIGSLPTNKNPYIDQAVLLELKQLYPTANEVMLRANYRQLVAKHGLATRDNAEYTPMQRLKLCNSVIMRLAAIVDPTTTKDQLWETINVTIQTIPFAYIASKFHSVSSSILQRNEYLFKLAFICGSTDDTVIKDISDMKDYMDYTLNRL